MPKLEPCPGCGEDSPILLDDDHDIWHLIWSVVCSGCSMRGPASRTQTNAIEAWNSLATASRRAVDGERERVEDRLLAAQNHERACGEQEADAPKFSQHRYAEAILRQLIRDIRREGGGEVRYSPLVATISDAG